MSSGDAGNRTVMPGYSSGGSGRNPQGPVVSASGLTTARDNSVQKTQNLREAMVERVNMFKAPRRVEKTRVLRDRME